MHYLIIEIKYLDDINCWIMNIDNNDLVEKENKW